MVALPNLSSSIRLVPFSPKQRSLLNWWAKKSPVSHYNGIIAHGSIRAGKTFPMAMSFIEWAFANFDGQAFGLCGKTVGSFRRNVIFWLKPILKRRGYLVEEKRAENLIIITKGGKTNFFYVFGGRDERSQDLIQGATLAGVFFDEVALMPESFVNQATGRCSVEGAKYWFNCNPDSPSHWFKIEWLDKADEKGLLVVHFNMDDNPSLSEATKRRYQGMYVGVFFKRFILGLWVMAEGAIYDMWDDANLYDELPEYVHPYNLARDIAVDYGTSNPTVFLDIIDDELNEQVYVHDEYYYDGRKSGAQKTDSEYADDLEDFCEGKDIRYIVVDPSAASFIAEIKSRGFRVRQADNEVLDGIRCTATLIGRRIIRVNRRCENLIREIQSYVWDKKKSEKGKEQPLKKDDHAPDGLRYWVKTLFKMRRLMLQDAA